MDEIKYVFVMLVYLKYLYQYILKIVIGLLCNSNGVNLIRFSNVFLLSLNN